MDGAVDMDEYQPLAAEPPTPPAGPGRRPPITAAHVFTCRLIHRAMIRHVRPNVVPTAVIRFGIMPFLGNDDLPVTAAPDWRLDHNAINWCVAIFCVVFGIISIAIWACAVAAPQPAGQAIPSSDHYFLPADAAPPFNRSVLVAVDEQFASTILHPWLLACASMLALGSLGLLATGAVELFEQCRARCSLRRHTFATELGPVACKHEVQRVSDELNSRSSGLYGRFWDNARPALVWAAFWSLGVFVCIIPLLHWSAGGKAISNRGYQTENLGSTQPDSVHSSAPASDSAAAALRFGHGSAPACRSPTCAATSTSTGARPSGPVRPIGHFCSSPTTPGARSTSRSRTATGASARASWMRGARCGPPFTIRTRPIAGRASPPFRSSSVSASGSARSEDSLLSSFRPSFAASARTDGTNEQFRIPRSRGLL